MNPGSLNRKVLIQSLVTVSDQAGGTGKQDWVDEFEFMASVTSATSGRRYNYNQIVTEGWTHIIRTYYMGLSVLIGVRMRAILDDGTIMLIHSVLNEDYKNQILELACYADPKADKYIVEYVVDENGNIIVDENGNKIKI